jgi:uncharacterized protein YcfJ
MAWIFALNEAAHMKLADTADAYQAVVSSLPRQWPPQPGRHACRSPGRAHRKPQRAGELTIKAMTREDIEGADGGAVDSAT